MTVNLLNRLGSRGCLSLGDIIIGILREGMDLVNFLVPCPQVGDRAGGFG